MKTTTILLGATAFLAIGTPAFAQSSDDPFTGLRVGATGGYDITRAGSDVDDEFNEDNDQSIEGFVYGVEAGYDVNLGGVILGVEAELTESTAETVLDDGDFEGFGLGNVEAGRDLYLGARIGAPIGSNAMIYALGGYTNARYNLNATFDGEDFRQSIDTDGFRVGAGLEYAFSGNVYTSLEYRYSNYSEAEIDFENDDIGDVDLGGIDTDRHQIMAGIGLRF